MCEVRCKRCNRILKNKLSIERGFGETCYRIFKLNEANKPEVELEVSQEIAFLKLEIKTLKRMIRNVQINGVAIEPIERIRQDNHRPERTENKGNMASVITEMKEIFNSIDNVYDLLIPVNGRTSIELPPILA